MVWTSGRIKAVKTQFEESQPFCAWWMWSNDESTRDAWRCPKNIPKFTPGKVLMFSITIQSVCKKFIKVHLYWQNFLKDQKERLGRFQEFRKENFSVHESIFGRGMKIERVNIVSPEDTDDTYLHAQSRSYREIYSSFLSSDQRFSKKIQDYLTKFIFLLQLKADNLIERYSMPILFKKIGETPPFQMINN